MATYRRSRDFRFDDISYPDLQQYLKQVIYIIESRVRLITRKGFNQEGEETLLANLDLYQKIRYEIYLRDGLYESWMTRIEARIELDDNQGS